jgi:hypothetical protein
LPAADYVRSSFAFPGAGDHHRDGDGDGDGDLL